MKPFTAYTNDFTGQNFVTQEACVLSELEHVQGKLYRKVFAIVPDEDIHKQCQELREWVDRLEAKGKEYEALYKISGQVIPLRKSA